MQYNVSNVKTEKLNLNSSKSNTLSFNNCITRISTNEQEPTIYNPNIYVDNDFTKLKPIRHPKSEYSNTEHSDSDNICINQFRNLMNDIQNDLSKEEYILYNSYFEGKKISDMLDENNGLAEIEYDEKFRELAMEIYKGNQQRINLAFDYINKTIRKYNEDGHSIDISDELKKCEFCETITTENGYDAMVFKNVDGNYMIVNSCTNAKSMEDLCAIIYAMNKKAFNGNDAFLDVLFNQILVEENIVYTKGKDITVDYLKKCYEGQVEDNIEIIKKYSELAEKDGSKLELYGYSLGGGIQESAFYGVADYDDIYNSIDSVTVYNPFTLYLEGYREDSIPFFPDITMKKVKEKLLIYSAEEDVVSTLNDMGKELEDNTIYLQAKDIDSEDINSVKDFYGYIINGKGNHGYVNLDNECFNEYGNLTNPGEFKSIHETLDMKPNKQIGDDIDIPFEKYKEEDKYLPKYDLILDKILHLDTIYEKIDDLNEKVPGTRRAYNKLIRYVENNFGSYDYNEFADVLTDSLWIIVKKTIDEKTPDFADDIVEYAIEDNFKESFYDFITEDSNKEEVIEVIKLILMKKDATGHELDQINSDLEDLLNIIREDYVDYYYDEYITKSVGGSAISIVATLIPGAFFVIPSAVTAGYTYVNDKFIKEFDDKMKELINNL